jgi:antitoxin component of RelBE/YafQ-DinJ toxin-antitoxin module
MSKMKMTISIDESTKERAQELAIETGYNQSLIIELLLNGATKQDILDLYLQSKSDKKKK